MGATVHAERDLPSAQEAIDAALEAGEELNGQGYRVGPPWYYPVPIHGSDPPEYLYEGRVWYGSGPDALLNRFYSLLYEFEDAAILEAEYYQDELLAAGYEVYELETQAVTFDGRPYIQASFYFGLPGAELPKDRSRLWALALPGALLLTIGGLLVVGTRRK